MSGRGSSRESLGYAGWADMLDTEAALRLLSEALAAPTHWALLASAAFACYEMGVFLYERWGMDHAVRDAQRLLATARRRVSRADMLARIGPMLGLMGTLIPLGPGLAALGQGNVAALASAVTVAFDTTVLGLAVGIVGFCLSRARRGYYDRRLDELEAMAEST